MAVSADIFLERDPWRGPLLASAVLHAALFAAVVLYAVFGGPRGESWGGNSSGGEAMSATLVNSVPLPRSETETQNVLANQSKGMSQSLPRQTEQEPEAISIPAQNAKQTARPPRSTTQKKPEPVETAENNVVPFGEGGPVSGPYGIFQAGGAKGGFSMTGGGGDFGSRFSWYVDVVRRKVSENWLKYEIDPRITDARRVYITFDILRNGQPANIQLEQSSGVPSLDQSATRALQRIDTFGDLPRDYNGNKVSVEFWFDYKR